MTDDSLSSMLKAVRKFRDARNWKQYHTPKDVLMDLVREATEAMEISLWQTDEQLKQDEERCRDLAKEMADVLHALLILSDVMEVDLAQAFWDKLKEVDERYPAEEFKNKSTYKYKKKIKTQ